MRNYFLINILGFGLAGIVWGLARYFLVPVSETTIDFPLHYIMAFSISILGGLSLTYGIRDIKRIWRVIEFGFYGMVVSLIVGAFSVSFIFIGSNLFLPWLWFGSITINDFWNKFSGLEPNIIIGDLWILFFIMGAIIGAFFAIGMRKKIWPMAWRAGIGMALGSIAGPILGNLVGPLWLSYAVTFFILTVVMGLFIAWMGYGHEAYAEKPSTITK